MGYCKWEYESEISYLAQIYISFQFVPLVVIAQILYQEHHAKTLFCVWCWWTLFSKDQNKKRVFLATVCTTPFLSMWHIRLNLIKVRTPETSISRSLEMYFWCTFAVAQLLPFALFCEVSSAYHCMQWKDQWSWY